MMKPYFLGALPLAALLSQCVEPYPMGGPFGPGAPRPYSDQHERYRSEVRDYDRAQLGEAYERGLRDGRIDYDAGEQKNYARHQQNDTASTRGAYIDGYDKGFRPAGLPQLEGSGGYEAQPQADPAYNQGYDYGLRDRGAGRQPDVDAYIGRYDPRYRSSFESGYNDAYEARRR